MGGLRIRMEAVDCVHGCRLPSIGQNLYHLGAYSGMEILDRCGQGSGALGNLS